MDKKLWGSVVLLVVVVIGITFYYQNKAEKDLTQNNYDRAEEIRDEVVSPTETINANYQFRDGVHTFVGNISLPTPCHTYNAEALTTGNETEIVITTQDTGEMCAQVITERQFRVSFEAPEDQFVIASVNGEVVNLNLFEVPENENIDDLEVFIKG